MRVPAASRGPRYRTARVLGLWRILASGNVTNVAEPHASISILGRNGEGCKSDFVRTNREQQVDFQPNGDASRETRRRSSDAKKVIPHLNFHIFSPRLPERDQVGVCGRRRVGTNDRPRPHHAQASKLASERVED